MDSAQAPAPAPVVLVTNDDGIDAPGLRFLVDQLVAAGKCRVLVCAPDTSVSYRSLLNRDHFLFLLASLLAWYSSWKEDDMLFVSWVGIGWELGARCRTDRTRGYEFEVGRGMRDGELFILLRFLHAH